MLRRLENIPNDICGVECLESVKLLGLYIDSKLSFLQHVYFLIKVCTQRFYLLQQIRNKQGLTDDCLHVVFNSIIYL